MCRMVLVPSCRPLQVRAVVSRNNFASEWSTHPGYIAVYRLVAVDKCDGFSAGPIYVAALAALTPNTPHEGHENNGREDKKLVGTRLSFSLHNVERQNPLRLTFPQYGSSVCR